MEYVLGFDIGGTKCAVVLARAKEKQLEFLERKQIPTQGSWRQVLDQLGNIAKDMKTRLLPHQAACRIGISCGGPLDARQGVILSPPNLPGWDRVPVSRILGEMLGMEARLKNDADACALAEWRYGAGQGCRHMIFLTFGTGLGAGLILNSRLYEGACNMAGEVGHIRLEADGPTGYGKAGSFEGFCSGGGIARLARAKAKELEQLGRRASYVKTCMEAVTAKDVALAAEAGEADAIALYKLVGRQFGRGLSILIDILNPERIVVGSIFARSGRFLAEAMEEEIRKEALPVSAAACRIVPALLGEQIGDYASAVAALE